MIAIPNMSKPKSCFECFAYDGEFMECRATGECVNETFYDKVLPDCPLIEIDPYNWANDLVFVVAEIEKARERLYKVSKIECERKRNDSNT